MNIETQLSRLRLHGMSSSWQALLETNWRSFAAMLLCGLRGTVIKTKLFPKNIYVCSNGKRALGDSLYRCPSCVVPPCCGTICFSASLLRWLTFSLLKGWHVRIFVVRFCCDIYFFVFFSCCVHFHHIDWKGGSLLRNFLPCCFFRGSTSAWMSRTNVIYINPF